MSKHEIDQLISIERLIGAGVEPKKAHSLVMNFLDRTLGDPSLLLSKGSESRYPPFPKEAYVGLAGEVSALYAEHLESAQQLFYIDYLTVLGASVCRDIRLASALKDEPRIYNVKVGESAFARKSHSQNAMLDFYGPFLGSHLRLCIGAGSAEGLARHMGGEESPENQPDGKPTLLVYDEFRGFVSKAQIQGSVLLEMVTSLFLQTCYGNTTKHSKIDLPDAHLVVMAACTTDTWQTMFTPQFRAVGLLNRLFLVTGRREERHSFPEKLDPPRLEGLREQTRCQIEQVKRDRPEIDFDADGRRLYDEWYYALPESPNAARLDSYILRFLMLFAITTGRPQLDKALVRAAIALMDYELVTRKELDPLDTEGAVARMEWQILRQLGKGKMARSRLMNLVNAKHVGVWVFEMAWKNLVGQGWVENQRVGRGVVCWLAPEGEAELRRRDEGANE